MSDRALARHAARLGLKTSWRDATGKRRRVSPDSLRRLVPLLNGGEYASAATDRLPPMIVVETGMATNLPAQREEGDRYRIVLEDGQKVEGRLRRKRDGSLVLPPVKVVGYHRIELGDEQSVLAVAPRQCPAIAALVDARNPRCWGTSAQIYGLRENSDGGLGHFSAVGDLAVRTGRAGGDALMLSPVHAMFTACPEQYSPYSPSSRLFLNVFLIDPHAQFDGNTIRTAMRKAGISAEELHKLEDRSLIHWTDTVLARVKLLRALYDVPLRQAERNDFTAFMKEGGMSLQNHAVFEALHAQDVHRGPRGGNWRLWQKTVRHPGTPEVENFAREMKKEVNFHKFLQWLAARGLQRAQEEARSGGMRIGLIGDLAVGVDPRGSECWCNQTDHLLGLSIGAPPDALSSTGQNWGLTTYSPRALAATGYCSFIEMVRNNLRYVGGLRIDHVMGMERLWVIPEGGGSEDGAYLSYPREDLLRLTALEATRAKALVIGEDLGTVEPEFREAMARHALLGMNVLPFQRDPKGQFVPSATWSKTAVAMTTTHDLPTVAGWWQGGDLAWREKLGEIRPGAPMDEAEAVRSREKDALWLALSTDWKQQKSALGKVSSTGRGKKKTLPGKEDVAMESPPSNGAGTRAVVDMAINFVTATPCPLVIAPLEDLLGLVEQPNIPGTLKEHPNWCRRYPETARKFLRRAVVSRRLAALRAERPR